MTFEFVAFSDVHWHPYSFGSSIIEVPLLNPAKGWTKITVNSRLYDIRRQMKSMLDYMHEHKITVLFFCGDWFHLKESVSKTTLTLAIDFLTDVSEREIETVMIPGNHDYETKDGRVHSLLQYDLCRGLSNIYIGVNPPYHDYFRVYDRKNDSYVRVICIPYTEDRELLLSALNTHPNVTPDSEPRICLFHAGIQGAKIGSDFILKKSHDIHPDEVANKDAYTLYLGGHYHEHSQLWDNAWMVGSPLQMEWSDAGGTRGFVHGIIDDNKKVTIKHIPTDRSIPQFIKLNSSEELCTADVQGHDFVKVKVTEEITEDFVAGLKGFLHAKNGSIPAYLEFIPVKKEEEKEDIITDSFASTEALLEEWINRENTKLDKEKLLELGSKFISKVRQEADE